MRKILYNRKLLILITVVFFLLINSAYYWQVWSLRWLIGLSMLLLFLFLFIFFAFFIQLLKAVKEKFQSVSQLALVFFMGLVLALAVYRPGGVIDFEQLEGKTLLIASNMGIAGCNTTLKLRSNQRYSYHSVCFGYEHTRGSYRQLHDTILFINNIPRQQQAAYSFAIIHSGQKTGDQSMGSLALYTSKSDSLPQLLRISENELSQ